MSPPKSELATLFPTFWSPKNAEPSPRFVELGASLAHSGRKQPAKRSTSPIKMWIQKVSVIIPGPCCPDKSVASEKVEVQLVTLGIWEFPWSTLCFYFCTARTDWFTLSSYIRFIRCKVIAGDSHFQTWLEKKRSQQCLTSPCRGCGKWFGPANHKHRQPCFSTLCSPFQLPINLLPLIILISRLKPRPS